MKDINGRYLKFKIKHPVETAAAAKTEIALTPIGESLLTGDTMVGIDDFGDTSAEFMAQI